MGLEVEGKTYETDEEGYLVNLDDWTPEVAVAMSKREGAKLSESHWEVINYVREYYQEYRIVPAMRILIRVIGKRLGKDKGNSQYLYELFPDGPIRQARKYAGLPKPTGCLN